MKIIRITDLTDQQGDVVTFDVNGGQMAITTIGGPKSVFPGRTKMVVLKPEQTAWLGKMLPKLDGKKAPGIYPDGCEVQ